MSVASQIDPALWPGYASSAFRVARRRLRGPRRHSGDAAAICRAVVDSCWTGEYLAASGGHFRQAWTRDLGFAAGSLVALGQVERLRASLAWMLDAWRPAGRVTTTIHAGRRPRDVWTYGIDSVPLLVHALHAAGADDLVGRHADWLAAEVRRFGVTVIDPATGLVRDDRIFSSHRDTVRTRSNAYANAMLVLLDRLLRETDWFASPAMADVTDRFVDAFWRRDRFVDRADGATVTGDATVAPFFFGAVPDDVGLGAALVAADEAGLVRPLPLRYSATRDAAAEDPVQRRFVPDYQGTAIWTSLGAMYLRLLQRAGAPPEGPVTDAYRRIVERDGTVWEVFDGEDPRLRPYRGRFGIFVADESMLWGAILAEAFAAAAPAVGSGESGRPSERDHRHGDEHPDQE
jgi:hypothetical protein